ncbi:MAG: glycosyltransferase family 2 protein [Bacteroidia bacterium]
MTKVGLVTVLFNSDEMLEGFFKSVAIQTLKNSHLYLVDNSPCARTDKLINELTQNYPQLSYTHIKNNANYGVAKGNNQGIKQALTDACDFVILLNNDIEFNQAFLLEEMVNYAIEKKENMIIPKILFFGTRKIWMAGGEFIHYKGTSRSIGKTDDDSDLYNHPGYFNYAPTCFMLISKKVFESIGLMDENYFVYYDDNDFVIRAVKKGFKIYFLPGLEVFHKVSFSTGGYESLFSIYYLNRNRIYFIKKHYFFPLRYIALAHAIATKFIRYLMYDSDRKKELYRGLKDGFLMTVPYK